MFPINILNRLFMALKAKPIIADIRDIKSAGVKIETVSQAFYDLVIHFECSGDVTKYLKAYMDTGGVPTIGIGTTVYPNGVKVKMGDVITESEALRCFNHDVKNFIIKTDSVTRDDITQGMFDSLVDFNYNTGALQRSTLLKIINNNLTDFSKIEAEWYKWKFDNGKIISGLIRRRKCEFYLYKNGVNHPTYFL